MDLLAVDSNMSETSRIEFSTKSIEIDSSDGNLLVEAVTLVLVIAALYIGKKIVDKYFN